ncbi:cupin domain-containing protein [Sphingomonas sp. Y38-1Y]|uniref:cupin domain-containing protein n=1 Tax=Sphingomonas sp. Y38-1Y TaxID=3078265 RepID=UPI0028E77DCF|nr:cupin domain-containing protein [Sphingomonas sp. Y38-1Y]
MQRLMLGPRGGIPNNPALPVRLYRAALHDPDLASAFEARFGTNGWPPAWRDGVFDYHHYHSTAHEVLGCYAGRATLTVGGPGGEAIDIAAGDAILLPAGTGHKCERASDDFAIVGAYPAGQDWDIVTEAADDAIRARIAAVPGPERDPVSGAPF